jgi:hypothetical protein
MNIFGIKHQDFNVSNGLRISLCTRSATAADSVCGFRDAFRSHTVVFLFIHLPFLVLLS